MSDFGQLRERIEDDINRTDISSRVLEQIKRSIHYYARTPMWFNEAIQTLTASSSASFLTVPSDYLDTVELYIKLDSGQLVRMLPKPLNEIIEYRPTAGSQPGAYCYFNSRFELDFEVSKQYEFPLYYIKELGTLSASTDSNLWTTVGEDLIVARAEKVLYRDVLKNEKGEAAAVRAEREARTYLLGFRDQKIGSGNTTPWGY